MTHEEIHPEMLEMPAEQSTIYEESKRTSLTGNISIIMVRN